MVSRGEDKYVIWPIYFDKSVSRSEGRKISKKQAADNPSLEDISKAAKSLGLKPIAEKNAGFPSRFWKKEGRILVDKKEPKSKILKKIASKL